MAEKQEGAKKLSDQEIYSLLPPKGDATVGYKVFELLTEILDDKKLLGLHEKWKRNYELARNKHWRTKSRKVNLTSANLLHAHRQRTTNMLTDNNPTFDVVRAGRVDSTEEVTAEAYNVLNKTADSWWRETEQQSYLERSILAGETNGCAIEKVLFNDELESGLGDVETEIVDPFYFGVYPPKQHDNQKGLANLYYFPMSVKEARQNWPEFADSIKPDGEILEELGSERREIVGANSDIESKGYMASIAGVVKSLINFGGGDAYTDADEVLVCECWVKDRNPPEGENYPGNIRCVTVLNCGRLVVSDRGNPSINQDLPEKEQRKTYLFDKFPFTRVSSLTDTISGWGMSDFEQLEDLQMEVDKCLSQMTTFKDKAARLKLVNPKDSGVPNEQLTNAPGIINPSSSMVAQGIRYVDAPKIPFDIVQTLEVYKDFFFLVAGTFDLEAANSPGSSVIAYKAIAALIERAATMIRGKVRNYGRLTRERGRMYISLAQNFYLEDRWITVNDDGVKQEVSINAEILRISARINIVSGSTLPVSKVQQREEAIELFKAGAIDQIELLKRLEWEDYRSVVKRMQAGPIGMMLDKLGQIGFPQGLLQMLNDIAQQDDKEFEKAIKNGEIPDWNTIHKAIHEAMNGQQPSLPPDQQMELEKGKAEIEKTRAETAKRMAETKESAARAIEHSANAQLAMEKKKTEQINQAVSLSGIELDKEKTKIEKAKAIAGMESATNAGTDEQGLASNNKTSGGKK